MQRTFDITTPFGNLMSKQQQLEKLATPPEEDPFQKLYAAAEFYEDISGMPLDKAMATAARKTEIDHFKTMDVYTKVKREMGEGKIHCSKDHNNRTPPLTFRTYQILPHTNNYFHCLYSYLDLLQ